MREQVHSEDSLSKLTAHIKTRDADWMVRDGALQRLGILLQDGALDPGDLDFGKQLKAVVGALCAQLPDNRSQLIKNACSTIVAFVEVLGDHPAMDRPLREQVFPAVLTLAGNGNKVLAAAGRDCLPQLVMHCHFEGLLRLLATTLKESRQAMVRNLCCVCLHHALQYWPLPTLAPVGALLEKTLAAAATDAANDVRSLARKALVQYQIAFPERAAAAAKRLPPDAAKLLANESSDAPPPKVRHVVDTSRYPPPSARERRPTSRPRPDSSCSRPESSCSRPESIASRGATPLSEASSARLRPLPAGPAGRRHYPAAGGAGARGSLLTSDRNKAKCAPVAVNGGGAAARGDAGMWAAMEAEAEADLAAHATAPALDRRSTTTTTTTAPRSCRRATPSAACTRRRARGCRASSSGAPPSPRAAQRRPTEAQAPHASRRNRRRRTTAPPTAPMAGITGTAAAAAAAAIDPPASLR